MLTAVIVLCLIAVAFWRSLLRFLVAALLALLVLGTIQAARAIGAITTVPPDQRTECPSGDQTQGSSVC